MSDNLVQIIAENKNSTGASDKLAIEGNPFSVQVLGETSSGAGAATVEIQVSNVPSPSVDGDWVVAGTASLTLSTARSSEALSFTVPYKYVRVEITAISGTGAKVSSYACGA